MPKSLWLKHYDLKLQLKSSYLCIKKCHTFSACGWVIESSIFFPALWTFRAVWAALLRGMVSNIPATTSWCFLPQCDHQNCLQTLPGVFQGQNRPLPHREPWARQCFSLFILVHKSLSAPVTVKMYFHNFLQSLIDLDHFLLECICRFPCCFNVKDLKVHRPINWFVASMGP